MEVPHVDALGAPDPPALRKRLADPELKNAIEKGILDLLLNDRGGGDIKRVQFASVAWDPSLNGKTLYDWAVKRGVPPTPLNARTGECTPPGETRLERSKRSAEVLMRTTIRGRAAHRS